MNFFLDYRNNLIIHKCLHVKHLFNKQLTKLFILFLFDHERGKATKQKAKRQKVCLLKMHHENPFQTSEEG